MQTRSLSIVPASFDDTSQSVGIIITTPTPVRTWIPDPSWRGPANECMYVEGDEVLLASGLDYSRTPGMPLCDGHNTGRVADVLGNVENVRTEGENVVGTAVYMPHLTDIYTAVKAGFLRQVSAGYRVNKYVQVERTDGNPVPLFHAVDWTLLETSHVPIGADAQATVRSAPSIEIPMPSFDLSAISKRSAQSKRSEPAKREDNPMADLTELVEAADAALQAVTDASDEGADDATVARAAKLRKFRADDTEDGTKDGDTTAADATAADATADPADDKAVDEARALARSYGLTKLVDDMRKLGSRSAEIKTALRSAIAKSAGSTGVVDVKALNTQRSAQPVINTRSIYENINARGKK